MIYTVFDKSDTNTHWIPESNNYSYELSYSNCFSIDAFDSSQSFDFESRKTNEKSAENILNFVTTPKLLDL